MAAPLIVSSYKETGWFSGGECRTVADTDG